VKRIKNLERFSGIDGKTLSEEDERISFASRYNIKTKVRRSHNDINTMGAVGAALSHAGVWEKFLKTGKDYCFVLEDDTFVPYNMIEQIFSASQDLSQLGDKGFDIWLIQYATLDKKVIPVGKNTNWLRPNDFYGFAGYIISKEGAKKLQQDLFPIQMHIDRYANMKMQLGELRVIINKNLRTGTLGDKSDIQLGGCRICNIPDDMGELRVINRWYIFAGIGYAAAITYLYVRNKD
jgi:GR25 family glycosyltransferase involved in LPS biosynthesis